MNLYEKLLSMQKEVDSIVKDGKNLSDKYDFASDEAILDRFRPMMDDLGLLLITRVTGSTIREGTTRSGTTRYFTEMMMDMVWHDVESGEELTVPWYAQGVDLAGEKGVGKALTYGEKYFLLKFFHVPTKKDDPDRDQRTGSGEKRQTGTQAAKETAEYMRAAVYAILHEVTADDPEKIALAVNAWTKDDKHGYDGVTELDKVTDAALPVVYKKAKKSYEKRTGKAFTMEKGDQNQ